MTALMMAATMPTAQADAKPWQQPARDHGADDADNDVADQSEAEAFHDKAGKPARDRADDEPSNQTFDHDGSPPVADDSSAAAKIRVRAAACQQTSRRREHFL